MRTLRNAVDQDRVHHAYLFVGSRGTGKTSMAKILAACLNCERGPTVEPCGTCDSCRSIASATSLDVIEMDAASSNSVEDVRDLRERVAYAPVSGHYKVYILDEAHMLSTQAWNAFLKTLEEPPPHTVFVLATTEAHKVLPTVVDRCHRFDFSRPTLAHITKVLRRVAEAESFEASDETLALIARAATGSFRDALGTLEQLVSYGGPRVELEAALDVLGIADADLLLETVEGVAAHDARRVLGAVARLAGSGRDLSRFYRDLEAHLRELLVVQAIGTVPESMSVTAERDAALAEQAGRVVATDVVRVLDGLAAALAAVRDGADERVQLELVLLKAATPRVDASTRALLARIERLEAALAGSAPPAPPAMPAPAPEARVTVAAAGAGAAAREPEPVIAPVAAPAPVVAALDLELARELWPAVIEAVATEHSMLAALLGDASLVGCAGGVLTLAFPREASFLKKKAEDRANRALVEGAVRVVTGHAVELALELRDAESLGAGSDHEPAAPPSEEEWIARLIAEFGAEEIFDDEREGEH